MKIRLISFFLSIALTFTFCVTSVAFDEDEYYNDDIYYDETVFITGDLNYDDIVDSNDVQLLLQYIIFSSEFTDDELLQVDIIHDGEITADDAYELLKIDAGICDGTPKEYTPWEVIEEPTCLKTGIAEAYCVTSGTIVTHILPVSTYHSFVDDICEDCGKEYVYSHIAINGSDVYFSSEEEEVEQLLGTPTEILESSDETFYVYARDYTNLSIAIFAEDYGLTDFYTTDASALLVGNSAEISISSNDATQDNPTAEVDGNFADFYIDTLGTGKPYAVIFNNGERDAAEISKYSDISTHERLVYYCSNALRAINDLKPFKYSTDVSDVARAHSQDMADHWYFSHYNRNDESPGDRLEKAGVENQGWGENIIGGYTTAFEMTNGWYNSAGHREVLLVPEFTHLGVGIAYKAHTKYEYYGTQNFIVNN